MVNQEPGVGGLSQQQQQHLLGFPWLDVIADYNINYVKVKIKKEITLIIVNNINNSCNYMESFNYMESPNFLSGDNIRIPIV